MKVGDLVEPKTNSNKAMIGIVLKIEEEFYNRNRSVTLYDTHDRLTVYWAHGETTTEPDTYVKKLAEDNESKSSESIT